MNKDMPYAELLAQVRKKQQEKSAGRRDPDELRIPKARPKERLEYLVKILPELGKGDICKGGMAPEGMELWYAQNGAHYHDRQYHPCPRVHDGEQCPLCQVGFDLLNETDDEEQRKRISRVYLPRTYYAVNAYVLNHKNNPEEIRGKVMWLNLQKTIWVKLDACLQSDDEGNETDPKAAGVFFHPWKRTYALKIVAFKKGDYNNYEESALLPLTLGPLAALKEGGADEKRIQEILDQRIYIPERFGKRNVDKLKAIAHQLLHKTPSDDASDAEDLADEVVGGEPSPAPKKKAAPQNLEEEEPAPKVKPKVETKKVVEEAEEVPEDDTPAPAKKTAAKTEAKAEAADTTEEDTDELNNILSQINANKKK